MTISYPLTLPASPAPNSITLTDINNIGLSRCPYTYFTQVQKHAGQSWAAEVAYPLMTRAEAAPIIAFIRSLKGQYGTFWLGDPERAVPQGVASGSPKVNGGSQLGGVLATNGWTPSITAILKKDDHIQIGTKLFGVLNDVTSDGSGNANIDLWPEIYTAFAHEASIVTIMPRGQFRLVENVVPMYQVGIEKMYDISLKCVEAR